MRLAHSVVPVTIASSVSHSSKEWPSLCPRCSHISYAFTWRMDSSIRQRAVYFSGFGSPITDTAFLTMNLPAGDAR